jgi:hypothetical protein
MLLRKEYEEWLEDKLKEIEEKYISIIKLLVDVKDFDNLINELGNPLYDVDGMIKGLDEYEESLKIYLEEQNKKPKFVYEGD